MLRKSKQEGIKTNHDLKLDLATQPCSIYELVNLLQEKMFPHTPSKYNLFLIHDLSYVSQDPT